MSLLYKATASQVVMLKLFLSSDHVTAATGKTLAITISKNGGAFGNPNAGATNATEVSSGWYKVTLDATDTGTEGDLVVRGTSASCDDSERAFRVHLPPNFAQTSIDSNGRLDIIKIAGTTQTARDIGASVLLSSGTGTGQLDFTSGVVKANLAQILGTALTETAGLLAGGFKKFFNVATPTGTLNSIPDAVAGATGGLFIAGTNAATTVTTALTTTFTGNLTGSVGSVTGLTASNLDTTVSSRLATAGYTTPPTVATILTTAITEAYRANGAAPTIAQFMSEVLAHLGESSIAGTTKTINKLDHLTPAETFTLDNAVTPAAITRAT